MIFCGNLQLYFRKTDGNFILHQSHDHGNDLSIVEIKKEIEGYKIFYFENGNNSLVALSDVFLEYNKENDDYFKIIYNGKYFLSHGENYIIEKSSVESSFFTSSEKINTEISLLSLMNSNEIADENPLSLEEKLSFEKDNYKPGSVCIVTSVKNEGIYLPHWIDYHHKIGIDHFFIYTNNNTDKSENLLFLLDKLPFVTIIDNTVQGSTVSPQKRAYTHAFVVESDAVRSYEWCLAIDADEYLSLSPLYAGSFKAFLNTFDADVASISLCWQFSKPSHANSVSDLLTPLPERNRKIIDQKYIGDGYRLVKTVFRTKNVVSTTPHFPLWKSDTNPVSILSDGSIHEYLYNPAPFSHDPIFTDRFCTIGASIIHYFSKSPVEFFLKTCRSRGFDPYVDGVDITRLNDPVWVDPFVASLLDEETAKHSLYGISFPSETGSFYNISKSLGDKIHDAHVMCAHKTWENFLEIKSFIKSQKDLSNTAEKLIMLSETENKKAENLQDLFDIVLHYTNCLNASAISKSIDNLQNRICNENKKSLSHKILTHEKIQNILDRSVTGEVAISDFLRVANSL